MIIVGTAPAARSFHFELGAMAREIPGQNCYYSNRYKHSQVPDAQVHAGSTLTRLMVNGGPARAHASRRR